MCLILLINNKNAKIEQFWFQFNVRLTLINVLPIKNIIEYARKHKQLFLLRNKKKLFFWSYKYIKI